jgi:hypothetical protein
MAARVFADRTAWSPEYTRTLAGRQRADARTVYVKAPEARRLPLELRHHIGAAVGVGRVVEDRIAQEDQVGHKALLHQENNRVALELLAGTILSGR